MKLTQILSEIYADEAIEKELSEYYDDPVIGFNQFTAKELVKMYQRAFVVDKPSVKMVKNFKKVSVQERFVLCKRLLWK